MISIFALMTGPFVQPTDAVSARSQRQDLKPENAVPHHLPKNSGDLLRMITKIVTPVSLGALGGMSIAILTNALIFGLGYGEGGQTISDFEAGQINTIIFAIVPFVWLFLFAAMGAAFMEVRLAAGRFGLAGILIAILMANCALYPVYTLGFSSSDAGLLGNYATALLAIFIIGWTWPISRTAALLLIPIPIWVTLASIGLYLNQTGRPF